MDQLKKTHKKSIKIKDKFKSYIHAIDNRKDRIKEVKKLGLKNTYLSQMSL